MATLLVCVAVYLVSAFLVLNIVLFDLASVDYFDDEDIKVSLSMAFVPLLNTASYIGIFYIVWRDRKERKTRQEKEMIKMVTSSFSLPKL